MYQMLLPAAGQIIGGLFSRKSKAAQDPYANQRMDILNRGKAVSERGVDEAIAGFTPLQQRAFEGIGSLAYTPAEYTRQSFTDPGVMEQFMSPYQRGVTDIAKREFNRQGDIAAQGQAAKAVSQGAFGGSRHGLVEAEMERNRQQGLGDIEAKGLQSAFDAAQKQFGFESQQEQQRQYLQDLADRFGFNAERSIFGDMLKAGGMQQGLEQKRLSYPQQALEDYAALFGRVTPSTPPTTPNYGSIGAGIGGLLGKAFSGSGGMASGNELFGLQTDAMNNISAGNIMAGSTPF